MHELRLYIMYMYEKNYLSTNQTFFKLYLYLDLHKVDKNLLKFADILFCVYIIKFKRLRSN